MEKLGVQEGEVIEHPWVTKAIERAQKRVEAHNFSIREHLLKYDDVMNKQREVIYDQRLGILEGQNLKETMLEYLDDYVGSIVDSGIDVELHPEEWDLKVVAADLELNLLQPFSIQALEGSVLTLEVVKDHFAQMAREAYERKEKEISEPLMREVERRVALSVIDEQWRDHLHEIDLLKEGIGLRAYGQKDPLLEYKKEAFNAFQEMTERIRHETVKRLFRVSLVPQVAEPPPVRMPAFFPQARMSHSAFSAFGAPTAGGMAGPGRGESQRPARAQGQATAPREPVRVMEKVGRNDPCPCGSGKKYKKCHGASA
jgi:preprotein translocase subunit SecA